MRTRPFEIWLAVLLGLAAIAPAQAIIFELPTPTGASIDGVLNTSLTFGAGIRLQDRANDLVGKTNLDPTLCTGPNGAQQSCQGLFKDQIHPAETLVAAPGAASLNNDNGNLNFDRGELFAAPLKLTSDLTLRLGDFGLFTRALWFHDFVNQGLKTRHPNRITADNYLSVGREATADDGAATIDPLTLLEDPNRTFTPLLTSRPWGQPGPNGGRISYGRGGAVRQRLSDAEVLRQIGSDLQWLDAYVYGFVALPGDRELSLKLGRQTINWGESTTLVVHSISQANPVNANNFYRIGMSLDEVFQPVNAIYGLVGLTDDISLEAYYQLEWRHVEAPAPGSYFSDLDIGTGNAVDTVSVSVANVAEDPQRLGTPLDSPLSGLSNTTSTIRRLADSEPDSHGQFGLALKGYLDIGNGLDLGLYYQRYHARLPLASFYATQASCARREGNDMGIDANDMASFLSACDDIPFLHAARNPQQPEAQYATDSAAALDSARIQLEYPKGIELLGISFNTTVGDFSIQGEVAYRPNNPLQVDVQDLAFAAFGPTLTRCHDRTLGCAGSAELGGVGQGYAPDGSTTDYGSSDFVTADGQTPYPDLINVGIGHIPGSARAFPSFVVPYRGGEIGDNPPCARGLSDAEYSPDLDCYIRGFERLETYHFNFGTTQIFGPNANPLAADQVIIATEWGATWVPGLPAIDALQFDAPGTHYHASAGADGSGADGSRLACSTNPACSFGPDGIRFNPHQQDSASFADDFSWGYRVIAILSYENVLPGISVKPTLIWSHDIKGTSPGPVGDYVERRKSANLLAEIRHRGAVSFNIGYTAFTGAGPYNLLRDRDFAQFYVRYQF